MKYHYSGLLQELYVLSAIITTFSSAPTVVIGSHLRNLHPTQLVTLRSVQGVMFHSLPFLLLLHQLKEMCLCNRLMNWFVCDRLIL